MLTGLDVRQQLLRELSDLLGVEVRSVRALRPRPDERAVDGRPQRLRWLVGLTGFSILMDGSDTARSALALRSWLMSAGVVEPVGLSKRERRRVVALLHDITEQEAGNG